MRLGPGEKRLYEDHPSWRALTGLCLRGALGTALGAATVLALTALIGNGIALGAVLAIVAAGLALTVLAGFARRVTTVYTLTNHRLHVKRGIVSRVVQETRLSRVRRAVCSQSPLEGRLGIGTVDFDTATTERGYELRFSGVANPAEVARTVDRAVAMSTEDVR